MRRLWYTVKYAVFVIAVAGIVAGAFWFIFAHPRVANFIDWLAGVSACVSVGLMILTPLTLHFLNRWKKYEPVEGSKS